MSAVAASRYRADQPPPVVLGMILFIASETVFFGGLFAAYYLLRSDTPLWPPAGAAEIFKPGPFLQAIVASLMLWGSSLPAYAAGVSLRREDFPVKNIVPYACELIANGARLHSVSFQARNTHPIAIVTHTHRRIPLTGFHALHMVVGLILLGGVLVRIAQNAYRGGNHAGPEAALYYWHFVDAVWLAVFATIYLAR